MKRFITCMLMIAFTTLALTGCSKEQNEKKIGVSLGTGSSKRWALEKEYMEERAKKHGIDIEVHLNNLNDDRKQADDCKEMIDNGISVLIIRPKDLTDMEDIVEYAHKKDVKVINYAGLLDNQEVDLFIGYDCVNIGKEMAIYLSEIVYKGDYIVLSGDKEDKIVTDSLYKGSMSVLTPLINAGDIRVLLDANVENWVPENAKEMVRNAILQNGSRVDAILAPNDAIAGACREVLDELQITNEVIITGMDAQLDAVKRIIDGKQSSTFYMDSKVMAYEAIDQAKKMMEGSKPDKNGAFTNGTKKEIPAYLTTGTLITKQNIDKILIKSGSMTKEEVYGQ